MTTYQPGDRVRVSECSVPDDWSTAGTVEEVGIETVLVLLDSGQHQEICYDEVTPLSGPTTQRGTSMKKVDSPHAKCFEVGRDEGGFTLAKLRKL